MFNHQMEFYIRLKMDQLKLIVHMVGPGQLMQIHFYVLKLDLTISFNLVV